MHRNPASLERRTVLNTTARILTGLIAAVLGFSSARLQADPPSNGMNASMGPAAGASTGDRTAERRHQCDDLLRRARQAMAEDNLDAAASLISQAEAMNVPYPLPFGDTPAKARRDLEKRTEARPSSGRSGATFPAMAGANRRPGPADPFAGRNAGPAGAVAPGAGNVNPQVVTPLPPTNQAAQYPMPQNPGLNMPNGTIPANPYAGVPAGDRAASDQLLIAARKALAVGDLRQASAKVQQVRSLNLRYNYNEDSPDKVEALISTYGDLMNQRAERGNTEIYRRQLANVLMGQADGLLRWQEFDEAERLANAALQCNVTFGPFETKPDTLLQRIADARRLQRGAMPNLGMMSAEAGANSGPAPSLAAKQRVAMFLQQARQALGSGDLRRAEEMLRQAEAVQVPDSAFAFNEDRPGLVRLEIQKARLRTPNEVVQASGQSVIPAAGVADPTRQAAPAVYDQGNDPTRNVLATNQQPYANQPQQGMLMNAAEPVPAGSISVGMTLFQQGEAALRAGDHNAAMEFYRQAAARRNELNPAAAQALKDRLMFLSSSPAARAGAQPNRSLGQDAAANQQLLARQMMAEVSQKESTAAKQRETDPKGAVALLEQTRAKVESAGLEPTAREQLLRRLDRSLADTRKYIEDNRPRIEMQEHNRKVEQDVQRQQQTTLDVQQKVALMVEEYNNLMREQRWAEAEIVAKRAAELDPTNPVAQQIKINAGFVRRHQNNRALQDDKENGFLDALASVDRSGVPFDDRNPYIFPDAKEWSRLSTSRAKFKQDSARKLTEREMEIQKKLKTPVLVQFDNQPLGKVIETLGKLADVNVVLDVQGIAEEGMSTDSAVTLNLSKEVSLRSALNLILQPHHLSYVIKDEVLKITSEQLRAGEIYTKTYSVADLIVPIPNFVPGTNMGLAGALHDAYGSVGFHQNNAFGGGMAPMAVVASRDGTPGAAGINPAILAQASSGSTTGPTKSGLNGMGPGGAGGGVEADFDALIDLITSTVRPTTWDAVGGPGSIAPFETNLSLVISQTQEVHEEIVDLLEQLRRLQDLQVTIEVRFITLNDNFFERVGVDFNFNIPVNVDKNPGITFGRMVDSGDPETGLTATRDLRNPVQKQNLTVGMSAPGVFNADLDIPFTQGSYALATPQFGGFDATAGASLGFAILSDIEAFFFINAAQGDRRSNVLQAPKVTLFNGQQANVADMSQSPFVISVIPVVGDFAAAQQPVIVILSEGTFLTVQAVISNDRRFVRLTLVPFFSRIGDVNTFKFTGSTTTTESSSEEGNQDTVNDNTKSSDSKTTTDSGTTVQLPTFSFVTVTTTVSVPDGGTVLLGGIKRLSEGRNEFGVPILDKVPYLNRLFKNVGIGRETQSLMMMVTPRIIIQEEEEERLGIQSPP